MRRMTNKNHSRFVGSIICVFVGAKLGGKYILFNQLISNGPKWSETGWIIAHLKVSCTSTQEKWERPHFTKTSLVINGAKLIMRSVHWVKGANHASILLCHPAGQWCWILHVYKLGGRNFQGPLFSLVSSQNRKTGWEEPNLDKPFVFGGCFPGEWGQVVWVTTPKQVLPQIGNLTVKVKLIYKRETNAKKDVSC